MISTENDPVRQGMRLMEGGAVTHDGAVRDQVIVLGLDDQHVAAKGKPMIISTGMADLAEIEDLEDLVDLAGPPFV